MSSMIRGANHPLVSPGVDKLHRESARRGSTSIRLAKHLLLGNAWVLGLGLALAGPPASAQLLTATQKSSHREAEYTIRQHRPGHREVKHASKEPFGDMPKGSMQIIISINQQKLHFYSDGKHVADAPVATGVPGHLTPLGVFSVIQRDRYHHSNLYSNAPMPYMERITWSGVALHEGPGVGHQASHGCIRMPHDFAARLWELPTMGMRVIIARPELRPVDFADPHLFVHKDKPALPSASLPGPIKMAQTVSGAKTDAAAALLPAAAAIPHSAAGNTEPPQAAQANPLTAAPAGDVAQTANPAPAPAASNKVAEPVTTNGATGAAARAEAVNTAQPIPAEPAAAAAASKPAEQAKSPLRLRGAIGDAANAAVPADIAAPIALDDVPLPLAKPERIAKSGGGPIAIFVSRKLGKIFVRQNFMPLFEAPVQIEHPEQPFGTHVFTALDYLPDHSTLRWNVVSLPGASARTVEHFKYVRDAYGRRRRERVEERVVERASPPETPQEVLARIDIPQDVIDQISQLIVPGSSLVVSDQGLGPETGSGTDFIVVAR